MRPASLRAKILGHLFLVYISWGSSYIGFKLTLEVLGPFLACGCRMALAGGMLALVLAVLGRWNRATLTDWRHAAVFGIFMVLMASGFLSKGQMYIDSSVAAVLVGSTPISMLVGGWIFAGEPRPSGMQWLGLLGGLAGLLLLGVSQNSPGGAQASPVGIFWVLGATLAWVAGSLCMRKRPFVTKLSAMQSCALLLFAGGMETILLGLLCGEAAMTRFENLRPEVALAFAWMVVGGSILAYSSYFWLLEHASIATAVSYEYVVPVIGVFLGWRLGGENVNPKMLLACCMTVGSVFFLLWQRHSR